MNFRAVGTHESHSKAWELIEQYFEFEISTIILIIISVILGLKNNIWLISVPLKPFWPEKFLTVNKPILGKHNFGRHGSERWHILQKKPEYRYVAFYIFFISVKIKSWPSPENFKLTFCFIFTKSTSIVELVW